MKLKANTAKSAVDRPCRRTFPGFSFTSHIRTPKIHIPAESIKGMKGNLKKLFRQGRGRNLRCFIQEDLDPRLRGWLNYFRLAEVKSYAEEIDKWISHRLWDIIWRQWKRPCTRYRGLKRRGTGEQRAWKSAMNGRGPWWNAGASHMNDAFRKNYFDKLGLYSLVDELGRQRRLSA